MIKIHFGHSEKTLFFCSFILKKWHTPKTIFVASWINNILSRPGFSSLSAPDEGVGGKYINNSTGYYYRRAAAARCLFGVVFVLRTAAHLFMTKLLRFVNNLSVKSVIINFPKILNCCWL